MKHPALLFILPLLFLLSACGDGGSSETNDQQIQEEQQATEQTALTIVSHTPAAGATNVAIDTVISVVFDQAIDADTLTGQSVTLSGETDQNISGSIGFDEGSLTLTFTPQASLEHNQSYTFSLSDSICSTEGVALESYSFGFGTGDELKITTHTPAKGATNVAIDTAISVVFDQAIDTDTLTGQSVTLTGETDQNISGSIGFDEGSLTLTFTPQESLDYNQSYTFSLTEAISSAKGVALESYSFSFDTGGEPKITAVSISEDETVGPYHPFFTVTFSEAMDESTLSGAITLSDTAPLAATISYDEATRTATLTPDTLPLPEETTFTLNVATDAKSAIGHPLSDVNSTAFQTGQKRLVLKTGQTTSYETYDDGYYKKGASRSYSRSNNIVTDETTGLMWQDDAGSTETWTDAITYCENLALGGHDDWRLPTIKELRTLPDYGSSNPATDTSFVNMPASNVWSSTPISTSASSYALYTNFYYGTTHNNNKTTSNAVRCVRSEELPQSRFVRTAQETVVDTATGLIWQDDSTVGTETKKWDNALAYCEDLILGGHDDWRLPNINELESIADYTRFNPATDAAFQNSPASGAVWSSSSRTSAYAWQMAFYNGYTGYNDKTTSVGAARCVRN